MFSTLQNSQKHKVGKVLSSCVVNCRLHVTSRTQTFPILMFAQFSGEAVLSICICVPALKACITCSYEVTCWAVMQPNVQLIQLCKSFNCDSGCVKFKLLLFFSHAYLSSLSFPIQIISVPFWVVWADMSKEEGFHMAVLEIGCPAPISLQVDIAKPFKRNTSSKKKKSSVPTGHL